METIESNPILRDAFDLLKKEYQDIIAETLGKFSRLYPKEPYNAQEMIDEYARSTGETRGAVRKRYQRALKKLKENIPDLEKSEEPPEGDKI